MVRTEYRDHQQRLSIDSINLLQLLFRKYSKVKVCAMKKVIEKNFSLEFKTVKNISSGKVKEKKKKKKRAKASWFRAVTLQSTRSRRQPTPQPSNSCHFYQSDRTEAAALKVLAQ